MRLHFYVRIVLRLFTARRKSDALRMNSSLTDTPVERLKNTAIMAVLEAYEAELATAAPFIPNAGMSSTSRTTVTTNPQAETTRLRPGRPRPAR